MRLLVALFATVQFSVFAAQTPTQAVQVAVDEIVEIAANKNAPKDQKVRQLGKAIDTHVDIKASGARVLAKYAKGADKEDIKVFLGLYKQVLVNTYAVLLEKYENEAVNYNGEQIKKTKYAIVDTTIVSGDKKIPVSYRLIKRGDTWKIYDFVAEGISMTRSYSQQYQKVLKKEGVSGLNVAIEAKLAK